MKWSEKLAALIFAILLASATNVVQATDRFAGLDAYVVAAMKTWEVPGLAIAVVKDGEVVLARGYGVSELGKDRKVTDETVFTIASCTKSFVAACIGLLVEDGKLGWDDPVVQQLPNFELADPYLTKHLTLRDLLCHRSGLRRADLLGDGAGFDSKEILRRLKYLEPIAEVRTQYIYNNHMYTVLAEVVARVTGQPWEQFAAERLFNPLGMSWTTADIKQVPRDNLARRHWRSDEGIAARPTPRSGGGLYSSVGDMAQWLKLQLAGGAFGGRHIFKPRTIQEMHALQFSVPIRSRPAENVYAAQFYGCALGWFVQDYRGRKIVLHGGAWGAMVAMIPEEKLGVVVLSNLDLESIAGMLMYDVFDAYLVGPELAWDQKKWAKTWLKNEPPGYAYRPRDEARARLENVRVGNTKPSLPLAQYAGNYESPLYGRLSVQQDRGKLFVKFAEFTTEMRHWHNDAFYVRTPTRLTFDWLLTFGVSGGNKVNAATVKHVGWDKDEKDHLFSRARN